MGCARTGVPLFANYLCAQLCKAGLAHTPHCCCSPLTACIARTLRLAAPPDQVDRLRQVLHVLEVEAALQDVGVSLVQLPKRVLPRRQAEVQEEAKGKDVHCTRRRRWAAAAVGGGWHQQQ